MVLGRLITYAPRKSHPSSWENSKAVSDDSTSHYVFFETDVRLEGVRGNFQGVTFPEMTNAGSW